MANNDGTPVTPPAPAGETPPAGTPPVPVTFEKWLEAQPEEVKGHFEDQTRALKNALDAERTQRKEFEKKLKDAAKGLEKGSDERVRLEELASKLATAQSQADFYDAAHKAGVTNLRLAYLAAQDAGLISEKGVADFEALKLSHPQLFAASGTSKPVLGNAGAGTGAQPPKPVDMNALIRRAAGRRV